MDNQYCVYTHVDLNGVVRYVGSGRLCRANNRGAKSGRGRDYEEYVKKFGKLAVKIVEQNLSKDRAIQVEQEIYDKYLLTGFLLNTNRPSAFKSTDCINFSEYLYYDESSPTCLRWRIDISRKIKKDSEAGGIDIKSGYYQIMLKQKKYLAHRVLFEIIYGKFDKNLVVDHIDNNRLNNKISNLRLVSQAENSRNRTIIKENQLPVGIRLFSVDNHLTATVNHPNLKTKSGQAKQITKSFSINKYGYDEALRLAVEARQQILRYLEEELNTCYSENHKR